MKLIKSFMLCFGFMISSGLFASTNETGSESKRNEINKKINDIFKVLSPEKQALFLAQPAENVSTPEEKFNVIQAIQYLTTLNPEKILKDLTGNMNVNRQMIYTGLASTEKDIFKKIEAAQNVYLDQLETKDGQVISDTRPGIARIDFSSLKNNVVLDPNAQLEAKYKKDMENLKTTNPELYTRIVNSVNANMSGEQKVTTYAVVKRDYEREQARAKSSEPNAASVPAVDASPRPMTAQETLELGQLQAELDSLMVQLERKGLLNEFNVQFKSNPASGSLIDRTKQWIQAAKKILSKKHVSFGDGSDVVKRVIEYESDPVENLKEEIKNLIAGLGDDKDKILDEYNRRLVGRKIKDKDSVSNLKERRALLEFVIELFDSRPELNDIPAPVQAPSLGWDVDAETQALQEQEAGYTKEIERLGLGSQVARLSREMYPNPSMDFKENLKEIIAVEKIVLERHAAQSQGNQIQYFQKEIQAIKQELAQIDRQITQLESVVKNAVGTQRR